MPSNSNEYARSYYLRNKERIQEDYKKKTAKTILCEGCGKMFKESSLQHHLTTTFHQKHSNLKFAEQEAPVEDINQQILDLKAESIKQTAEANSIKEAISKLVEKMNLLRELSLENTEKARRLEKSLTV